MKRFILVMLALALVTMMVLPAWAQAPTLTISPTSGPDGTTITYHGTGYTPNGPVSVLLTGDGLIVDETEADANGAIHGTFTAPARSRLTGESTNTIPVFTIDGASGAESARVTFTYVQGGQLPPTGSADEHAPALLTAALLLLVAGGATLRRVAARPHTA
jgi:hypothetical protein